MDTPLNRLSATAGLAAMASGETTSSALLESCLDRIETRDALLSAWVYVDRERALTKAREADAAREAGQAVGPLHGLPVAIKDIFDTDDMPTECGSELYRGRRPAEDARAVSMLRRAGAIIIGKTVTAELALSAPGPTANPLDLRRTPGGSSSGSAAAVADYMVPLAVGSQTGGSVIRPASFCGIVGFKPSFDGIPTVGMHLLAKPLDHAGVFARDVADISLITNALMPAGDVVGDATVAALPGPPRIGVLRAPVWREADDDARARFDAWTDAVGMNDSVDLGEVFDDAVASQGLILDANLAANFAAVLESRPEALKAITRERVRGGLAIEPSALDRAMSRAKEQRAHLRRVFEDYDALLTLAAPGEAPLGLSSTGDAVFSVIWTLMGVPAITLPRLTGEHGLPIGIQLIGAPGEDAKLLAIAAHISTTTNAQGGESP